MLNFGKNIVVGVSVTPEIGLEVAQIDFLSRTVLKYESRQLEYDINRKEIADLDIFKESLLDLFNSMGIPKGSNIVLNLQPLSFKVAEFPASITYEQVKSALEEELNEKPVYQNVDPISDVVKLPSSTIQSSKYVAEFANKTELIEIVMQIEEMGYNVVAVDSSVNSTLNALIYNERVNVNPEVTWLMVQIESNCCRLISMQGKNYVDTIEEPLSIGEVLGDEENYSTVVSAIQPLLKNLPSQYMFIVSKTNIISAEIVANKLTYSSPIIHQEANIFAKETFINVSSNVDSSIAKTISLDVIGAAIKLDFSPYIYIQLNMFNAGLGEIWLSKQPPVYDIGFTKLVFNITNSILYSIIVAVVAAAVLFGAYMFLNPGLEAKKAEISSLDVLIEKEKDYLKRNETVSTELFDEGDEIRAGLVHNKSIYSYFTIVGTEIPRKLWLTSLKLGEHVEIEGQADNLESIYAFFRNIKDYDPSSAVKLQKLGLATKSKMQALTDEGGFDTESILTSMTADFYEFRIADVDAAPVEEEEAKDDGMPPRRNID